MAIRSKRIRFGVTLIELMVVVAIVGFLLLAVGTVLVDSQNAWNTLYKRSNSGPVVDGLIASKEFDRAVRKATVQQCDTDNSTYLRVYYYKDPMTSADYDGCSEFFFSNGVFGVREGDAQKNAGTGDYGPTGSTTTRNLANNVTSCTFNVPGASIEMVLRLDAGTNTDVKDGNVQMTVTCSAVRHNL